MNTRPNQPNILKRKFTLVVPDGLLKNNVSANSSTLASRAQTTMLAPTVKTVLTNRFNSSNSILKRGVISVANCVSSAQASPQAAPTTVNSLNNSATSFHYKSSLSSNASAVSRAAITTPLVPPVQRVLITNRSTLLKSGVSAASTAVSCAQTIPTKAAPGLVGSLQYPTLKSGVSAASTGVSCAQTIPIQAAPVGKTFVNKSLNPSNSLLIKRCESAAAPSASMPPVKKIVLNTSLNSTKTCESLVSAAAASVISPQAVPSSSSFAVAEKILNPNTTQPQQGITSSEDGEDEWWLNAWDEPSDNLPDADLRQLPAETPEEAFDAAIARSFLNNRVKRGSQLGVRFEEAFKELASQGYTVTIAQLKNRKKSMLTYYKSIMGTEIESRWPHSQTIKAFLGDFQPMSWEEDGWSFEETLKLINEYVERKELFDCPTIRNTHLWNEIVVSLKTEFPARSQKFQLAHVIKKWDRVHNYYNKLADQLMITGNGSSGTSWPYYDVMDLHFSKSPASKPDFTMAVGSAVEQFRKGVKQPNLHTPAKKLKKPKLSVAMQRLETENRRIATQERVATALEMLVANSTFGARCGSTTNQ